MWGPWLGNTSFAVIQTGVEIWDEIDAWSAPDAEQFAQQSAPVPMDIYQKNAENSSSSDEDVDITTVAEMPLSTSSTSTANDIKVFML